MELVLIRHGETVANVAREAAEASGADVIDIGGRDADVQLSELGRQQAQALGEPLARLSLTSATVWTSPYQRARSTAQFAMQECGQVTPIVVDERLRDRELGVLDALTSHGVQARYPAEAERRRTLGKFYYRPPGGEAWTDVALRLRSFLGSLTGDAIVFTHDAVITMTRYVCCALNERDVLDLAVREPIGNASISRLSCADGMWRVVDYSNQTHLLRDGRDLRTIHPGDPDVHPR